MASPARRLPLAPLLSALLLWVLMHGFGLLAAAVVPYLVELMERAPRLAALGWLALLTSPLTVVALAHRATHGVLDRLDVSGAARGPARGVLASVRAGMVALFGMWFASLVSALLLLFFFPPPPEERGMPALLRVAADVRIEAGVHAALWVGAAWLVFVVHRSAARDEG